MGRPKGSMSNYTSYTVEQKWYYIKSIVEGKISLNDQSRKHNLSSGLLCNWIKKYNEFGLKGLENKRKPGNMLTKFLRKKELTELEKLQYENLILRIENERLKKGYTSKEADLAKRKK